MKDYSALIFGGGMFGLYSAILLAKQGKRVVIVDKEGKIFDRASKVNQSRVHSGYHYPRSIETASKACLYYQRFCNDFSFSLVTLFKQHYSIASINSKVSATEYERFCKNFNMPLKLVDSGSYFKPGMVEATYETEESCFNFEKIRDYFIERIKEYRIDVLYNSQLSSVDMSNDHYVLKLSNGEKVSTSLVINTTYSSINLLNRKFFQKELDLKYELCQLDIYNDNGVFGNTGVTVMDGDFFSIMPFKDGSLFSTSSVKFTPIDTSLNKPQFIKRNFLNKFGSLFPVITNKSKIESLAKSFLKPNFIFDYKTSIFEIKPILKCSEKDDSRPTIISLSPKKPYFLSVFSGKISSIYDLEPVLNELIDDI